MIETACKLCGVPLTRSRLTKRGPLCQPCRQRAYHYRACKGDQPHIFPKHGEPTLIHTVACRDCGEKIERHNHWRNPSCVKCSNKRFRKVEADRRHRRIEEARRYRILLAVSPYGSYEELLEALKVRNPKTREFRFDLTMQKRAH